MKLVNCRAGSWKIRAHGSVVLFMVSVLGVASPALALSIGVPNFSFENPNQNVTFPPATGWTPNGGAGFGGVANAVAHGFVTNGADDGAQYHFLNLSFNNGGPDPSFTQSNATLIGNAAAGTYTLTVAGGRRDDGKTTDGQYLIELLAGTSVIASQTLNDPLNTIASGTWTDIVALGVVNLGDAEVGQDLTIRLTASDGPNNQTQGQFDNVRLDFAVIPEPSTLLLTGLGIVGLSAVRRRRVGF